MTIIDENPFIYDEEFIVKNNMMNDFLDELQSQNILIGGGFWSVLWDVVKDVGYDFVKQAAPKLLDVGKEKLLEYLFPDPKKVEEDRREHIEDEIEDIESKMENIPTGELMKDIYKKKGIPLEDTGVETTSLIDVQQFEDLDAPFLYRPKHTLGEGQSYKYAPGYYNGVDSEIQKAKDAKAHKKLMEKGRYYIDGVQGLTINNGGNSINAPYIPQERVPARYKGLIQPKEERYYTGLIVPDSEMIQGGGLFGPLKKPIKL